MCINDYPRNSLDDGSPKPVLSAKLQQFYPLAEASSLSEAALAAAFKSGGASKVLQHCLEQAKAATEKKVRCVLVLYMRGNTSPFRRVFMSRCHLLFFFRREPLHSGPCFLVPGDSTRGWSRARRVLLCKLLSWQCVKGHAVAVAVGLVCEWQLLVERLRDDKTYGSGDGGVFADKLARPPHFLACSIRPAIVPLTPPNQYPCALDDDWGSIHRTMRLMRASSLPRSRSTRLT